jgi:hypothetical protein
VYQINVFLMIFAPHLNGHGVIACIGIGWSAMVTGQSLVLWSLLHLVCRSVWNLRLMLCMIIFDGLTMHGPQFIFSLLVSQTLQDERQGDSQILTHLLGSKEQRDRSNLQAI